MNRLKLIAKFKWRIQLFGFLIFPGRYEKGDKLMFPCQNNQKVLFLLLHGKCTMVELSKMTLKLLEPENQIKKFKKQCAYN